MSEWQGFFVAAGIPVGIASRYAKSFDDNRITRDMLPELDKPTLAELGIKAIGDQLAILRRIKDSGSSLVRTTASKPVRTPISAPTEASTSLIMGASEARKGRPPPDRHEIYHVKMPSGSTQKTRKILREAEQLKQAGVLKRASSGVRQGGRPVSPISQDATARRLAMHNKRNQMAEVSSSTDPHGRLYSDCIRRVTVKKVIGGGIQKKTVETMSGGGGLFARAIGQSVIEPKIRVRLPKTAPVITKPSASSNSSILPRITLNLGGGSNSLSVKSRGVGNRPLNARITIPGNAGQRKHPRQQVVMGNRGRQQVVEYVEDDSYMEDDSVEYVDEDYGDLQEDDIQYEDELEDSRQSIYSRITL